MATIEIDAEEYRLLLRLDQMVRAGNCCDGADAERTRESKLLSEELDAIRARRAAECTCAGHDGAPYLHEERSDCPKHGRKDGGR